MQRIAGSVKPFSAWGAVLPSGKTAPHIFAVFWTELKMSSLSLQNALFAARKLCAH